VSELNLMQLEGQALASTRAIARLLREQGLLDRWAAGGISATHHTAGRIDKNRSQVRRAICWNDHTLAPYHACGLDRLGGQKRVQELIGGPWAIRYSLSHLVKDEENLAAADWRRTWKILPHGPLAAGYLTGNFDAISLSAAASTGILDLRTGTWRREMLDAIANPEFRDLAWAQLPRLLSPSEPLGTIAQDGQPGPVLFPTSDDQQAGLVGGGAVDAGQVAVILGNSAVVNSSADRAYQGSELDVMRLNWGPFLWMRCYNNGAQFLDRIVGDRPDWDALDRAARLIKPGCEGTAVLPFGSPEPSLGVSKPRVEWSPAEPSDSATRFRAALEALAYLIALGVRAHAQGMPGGAVRRISVSGGIARSDLMCEILATVLDCPLERLVSFEGPALGAAVTALADLETYLRAKQGIAAPFTVADAVAHMVRFRDPVKPNPAWTAAYREGLTVFERRVGS
jgi:sugar (pentulose or hexulose) kinase